MHMSLPSRHEISLLRAGILDLEFTCHIAEIYQKFTFLHNTNLFTDILGVKE